MIHQTTLVATLGGQPQIVTFTLDALLQRGETITQVVVVYLASNPRYLRAYQLLAAEFAGDRYAGLALHLRGLPIRLEGAEVFQPQQVDVVHATFQQLLSDLKKQGQRVHLSLSGGRRLLALLALEAAMCYLRPADRVWHIYTPPDWTEQAHEGRLMHVPPGTVQLIEMPFASLSAYAPGLTGALQPPPSQQLWLAGQALDEVDEARCRAVWQELTPRQQEVLTCLAQDLDRSAIAEQLHIARSTVDTHRRVIVERCQAAWEELRFEDVDTPFLRRKFGPFLAGLKKV